MGRTRGRRMVAGLVLAAAPLALAGCGTPAGAATGRIVVDGSTCLGAVSRYITLAQDGRALVTAEIRVGIAHAFSVRPGSYTVLDGPLVQQVSVAVGRVVHINFLPICSPTMS